jgi:hypothetical protein
MMEEPTLKSQSNMLGEAMRAYRGFGIPGIDMLANRIELSTAKQCQSAVHQYGKEAMLSELYGVTGWDFDFRGHKFQGDWQAALGVTIRVPHLSWVSMKGESKRDYPASINYQSPWYKEYSYVEDHFARLNTALTRGKPDVSIGVIHPIESYWLYCGPSATTLEMRHKLDSDFENVINWLLFGGLDFDYISEAMFPDACRKAENPIAVGKMKYDVIVVPRLITMRKTTVERLKSFKKAGGRVIFMGECPRYMDCVESDEPKALYDMCEQVPFERCALINTLEENRKLSIIGANGIHTDNYIYQLRQDGRYKWLFIANAKDKPWPRAGDSYGSVDVSVPKRISVEIKGLFRPKLYDTVSAEITDVSFVAENGYTKIEFEAYLHDSFLLRLEKSKEAKLTVTGKQYESIGCVDFKKKVEYEREEPNVLLLDIAEWKWDDEEDYQPAEEIRRLDAKLRRAVGIPRKSGKQPWCLEPEVPIHKSTLKFSFKSDVSLSGLEFACEDMDIAKISLDGKPLEKKITGYFTDECIQKTELPDIEAGEHYIELTLPLAPRTYTENCFILGEFGVKLEGVESTLTLPTKTVGFGTVTTQGMPFYGGNLTYKMNVSAPEGTEAIKIHSSVYRGALVGVKVDGQSCGKIVYQPYSLVVDGIGEGDHTIELTLFGNRHNSFGALHNCDDNFCWYGPFAWITQGDSFSYEYNLKDTGILRSPEITFLKKKA